MSTPSHNGSKPAVVLGLSRYWYLIILAMCGFVTSFGAHIVATNLPAYAETVAVGAFAGGGISGGAFNPAVGIGPTIIHATMGSGDWSHLWLYLVGPLAGAAVAAVVFGIQEKGA